jgi:hypothetical protein
MLADEVSSVICSGGAAGGSGASPGAAGSDGNRLFRATVPLTARRLWASLFRDGGRDPFIPCSACLRWHVVSRGSANKNIEAAGPPAPLRARSEKGGDAADGGQTAHTGGARPEPEAPLPVTVGEVIAAAARAAPGREAGTGACDRTLSG